MAERSLGAALKAVADEIQNHSEVNWGVAVQRAAMARWAYALRLLALSIPVQGVAEVAVEDSRWQEAFEALHARLLRDLPGGGSELAPPDDAFWAAQLDALATFADEQAARRTGSGDDRIIRRVTKEIEKGRRP